MKKTLVLFLAAVAPLAFGQTPDPPANHGAAGLRRALLSLQTTASFLQVTAHPDDEDGGLLTMLSRADGVRVGLMTLTRGEGGQNKIGPELFDELGLVRTEELLAADRYYGARQFFSRAVDYGFSKTLAEALRKWRFDLADGGPVVGDIVRAIRTFRPEVLTARFGGTERDGHAHHQASSVMARLAFLEAGDPAKFPDQIAQGLSPWSPRAFFIDNIRASESWTVTRDVGADDPFLGMSYAQLAWEGISHQRSQGAGFVPPDPGARPDYYKRLDGTPLIRVLDASGRIEDPYLSSAGLAPPRQPDFFDAADDTLEAIAGRLEPAERARHRELPSRLAGLSRAAATALRLFDAGAGRPDACAGSLAEGLRDVGEILARLGRDLRPSPGEREAIFLLKIKEAQFRDALNRALSLDARSLVEPERPPGSPFPGYRFPVQTLRLAVPGESFPVSATLVDRSRTAIRQVRTEVLAPEGWAIERTSGADSGELGPNQSSQVRFQVTVARDAAPTAPPWRRGSIEEAVYEYANPAEIGKPMPAFPLKARFTYEFDGVTNFVETTVRTRRIDPLRGEIPHRLMVGPALSVAIDPPLAVVPDAEVGRRPVPVTIELANEDRSPRAGTAGLSVPPGWSAGDSREFRLAKEGDAVRLASSFTPPAGTPDGIYTVAARARGPEAFDREVELLEHPGIGSALYLRPARAKVVIVHTASPRGLKVGYVSGPEDAIPDVLAQMGVEVHFLTADDLSSGDLSRYQTIITGPRAYDVREDLRAAGGRLLDYVRGGGRLVVQYNQNTRAFDPRYFPFPASFPARNLRVVVEDSPVAMLHPDDPVWTRPNRITLRDFDGWVQERSLYCLGSWSQEYTPLLSMHDPGEAPIEGGLLEASYGKGTYLFTGLAFFRQLPEGVPGAIRIFVNLITPGSR